MVSRSEFLQLIWDEIINSPMQEHWIENSIREHEECPDAPLADTGAALKRLLALGASRRDLSLLYRTASYEAAFGLLYMLNDPGVEEADREMLHEELRKRSSNPIF